MLIVVLFFSAEMIWLLAFTSIDLPASDTFMDCTSLEDKERNVFFRLDRHKIWKRGDIVSLIITSWPEK